MLIHYIIVRRDLPVGVLAAMVTHAAGESAALYQDEYFERFKGCTAVVLEAKSESDLYDIVTELKAHSHVKFVEVHESSGPYMGQFMAIGVVPGERESLAPIFIEFQCLKTLDIPEA